MESISYDSKGFALKGDICSNTILKNRKDIFLDNMVQEMKSFKRIVRTLEKFSTMRIREISRLKKGDFSRKRKMFLEDILRYILSQKGKTIAMEINSYFKEIKRRGQRVTKQAFCKQRRRLNPEVFVVLNREYVESIYEDNEYKTYKDFIVTAVDSTILEIPNSEELQREYECQTPNKNGVRKSARARASGIYDVENNIMIDAVIDKYKSQERPLAKRNIENMIKILGDNKKIITIFDRGYMSIEMLLFLMDMPIFYLFRVKAEAYIEEKASMTSDDEIVTIKINKDRLNNIKDKEFKDKAKQIGEIKTRMVRIILPSGEEEFLITNIPYEVMNSEEIGQLYFKRWGIELAYDVIKNKLQVENFSGKKKIIIEQDFYAQMLLFNMVEDLRNDANNELELKNKNKFLKYDYKVNMNILIGTFRDYMIKIAIEEDPLKQNELSEFMLEEIMDNLVPVRTGRQVKRHPYTGRNKYRLNIRRNS